MARFKVSVPHRMGCQAALARVQPVLNDIHKTYGQDISDVHARWDDNRLEFLIVLRGYQVEGTLIVEDDAVHVSGPLQMPVLLYRSRIESVIETELKKLLGTV